MQNGLGSAGGLTHPPTRGQRIGQGDISLQKIRKIFIFNQVEGAWMEEMGIKVGKNGKNGLDGGDTVRQRHS